ncbi:MAG: response regulator [Betaproteobacteria bacterium]|nr:response regulator [Betaproteobacteria bacterium]
MQPRPISIHDQDYYDVSEKGTVELRETGTTLSSMELQILVLLNGRTTVARIAGDLGLPLEEARAIFLDLRGRELIVPSSSRALAGIEDHFNMPLATDGTETAMLPASEELPSGVSALESAGYYVAITRRGGGARQIGQSDKHTVLVVDDDAATIQLLQHYLQRDGFLLRTASSREEIVAALRLYPIPDVALLDVRMPDADGFEILAKIRAHPVLKVMPVVMMTALATRESVLKGLQLGADGYVTKPVKAAVMLQVVRTVLGLEHAG